MFLSFNIPLPFIPVGKTVILKNMATHPFEKFIGKKSNAAIKEKFKQERKAAKKVRAAEIAEYLKVKKEKKYARQENQPTPTPKKAAPGKGNNPEPMPLNKFLAHCGVASRREAVSIIREGAVKVNGEVVTDPAHRVSEKDKVTHLGKPLHVVNNLVYILLNKPKDYLTTTSDPKDRKTVLHLIKKATTERVYPVGRLDRNTSGVLLITNDGELTQRLTHPSFNVEKLYEAKLDKPLTKAHFDKILAGLQLEDGEIHADALGYPDEKDKSIVGIEMHSGRNRIVRRIFEHLGYEVKALDRVMYAGLTKKNVERGRWRFLKDNEIRILKHINKKGAKPKK